MKTLSIAALFVVAAAASAEVKTQRVEYRQGDTVLEGYLAYDDSKTGKRPGVLIVHDWDGLTAYEEGRARQLAQMGYVAFCADIYGKGVRPKSPQENGAQAGKYRNDPTLFRARLQSGLDRLKGFEQVNATKTAAMGYCFGGGGVLELARSGADVNGVISFHGSLAPRTPSEATNIKSKVLAVHAAQDPAVPREAMNAFLDEMKEGKIDYQLVVYNLNVHAFTVPGPQYDRRADERSWAELDRFLSELFA